MIHPIKSNLIPSQELTILGFILNSVDMSVRHLKEKKFSIREVARVRKNCLQLPWSNAWTTLLPKTSGRKKLVLKLHKRNCDALMEQSLPAKNDLEWWIKTLMILVTPFHMGTLTSQSLLMPQKRAGELNSKTSLREVTERKTNLDNT